MAIKQRIFLWSSRTSILTQWGSHSGCGLRVLPLCLPVIPVLFLLSQQWNDLNTGCKIVDESFGPLWAGLQIFGFIWSRARFIWMLLSLSINGSPAVHFLVMWFSCRMTILQWIPFGNDIQSLWYLQHLPGRASQKSDLTTGLQRTLPTQILLWFYQGFFHHP